MWSISLICLNTLFQGVSAVFRLGIDVFIYCQSAPIYSCKMLDKGLIQPGEEETLDIVADGIEIRTGFGLDIGGSMAKVVYATDEGQKIRFHFVSYPSNDVDEIVNILKEKLGGKIKKGSPIYSCGLGVQFISDIINKELNVKLHNTSEIDCFVRAFSYMTKIASFEDLFHPVSPSIKANTMKLLQQFQQTLHAFQEKGAEHKNWDVLEKEQKVSRNETSKAENKTATTEALPESSLQYPVLLCALGSGGAFIKVEEDGSYLIMDTSTRCGRFFVGLGKLLTHAKDFGEIVNLASKGDFEKLHVLGKDLKSGNEDDMYNTITDDYLVYSFGHAMTKSPDMFSREDIAAAWLNFLAGDLAQTIHLTAMAGDIPTICMCGSFVGLSQLVRDQISASMDFRCTANFKSLQYDHKFLRMGGYYGALGALLLSMGIDKKSCEEYITVINETTAL